MTRIQLGASVAVHFWKFVEVSDSTTMKPISMTLFPESHVICGHMHSVENWQWRCTIRENHSCWPLQYWIGCLAGRYCC